MRYIALFCILASCASSSLPPTIGNVPQVSSSDHEWVLKECQVSSTEKWEDTQKNFRCINTILASAESYLLSGNSSAALKISQFGITHYPFDARLRSSFKKALDTYTVSTRQLFKDNPKDCQSVLERIAYLDHFSPDNSMDIPECPYKKSELYHKSEFSLNKELYPKNIPEIEKEVFKNISSQLRYFLQKNNEDNSAFILFKTIEASNWELTSSSFDLSQASDENNISMAVTFNRTNEFDLYGVCDEIHSQLYIDNGTIVRCKGHSTNNSHLLLSLGKRDAETFQDLTNESLIIGGIFPKSFVYSTTFQYLDKAFKNYYLVTRGNARPKPSKSDTPTLFFPTSEQRGNDTDVARSPLPSTIVINSLKKSQVEGLKSITLSMEKQLTLDLYKNLIAKKCSLSQAWLETVSNDI